MIGEQLLINDDLISILEKDNEHKCILTDNDYNRYQMYNHPVDGSPIIRREDTNLFFFLSWDHVLQLALQNGLGD